MKDLEKRLLDHFHKLSEEDANSLLRFAAFLASDAVAEPATEVPTEPVSSNEQAQEAEQAEIPKPNLMQRPEKERVVDALKRLSAAYPMLEKKVLLDKASGLVAQHIMFGKPANEVIDQIEKLFADAYDAFVKDAGRG